MASKPKKVEVSEAKNEAAVDAAEETEGKAAPPKRKFPLMLVIAAAVGLLVVAGGGGAAFYLLRGGAHETKTAAPTVKPAVFFDVPEVLVNLSTTGNERVQYLKVKIVLELSDSTLMPQIQTTMPRVMDAFQTYLRELRPNDLDGSAGLYRLKEELTRRVNAAIAPTRINAVLFKEIVVQ
jgi:flagellar FliL protein